MRRHTPFTIFHLEVDHPKRKTGTVAICVCRVVAGKSESKMCKMEAKEEDFPELWEAFLEWYDGSILVGRDMKRTFRTLEKLLYQHNIGCERMFQTSSYLDELKKHPDFPADFDGSYKSIAAFLKLPKPNEHDIMSKAEFTGRVMEKLHPGDMPFEQAILSQPFERLTTYKKEGSPDVSCTAIDELRSRPLKKRFAGTYVAFTGSLKTADRKMQRAEAVEIVRQLGGAATDGKIDEHVTHLVTGVQIAGRAKSQKEREAEEDGIILIPADVFFTLISN